MNPQGEVVALLQSPKVAAGVATVGGVSGLGALFGFIPVLLGIVVSALTIIMLLVLIRMHWINSKKLSMELKRIEDEVKCRHEKGLPCRRQYDSIDCDNES